MSTAKKSLIVGIPVLAVLIVAGLPMLRGAQSQQGRFSSRKRQSRTSTVPSSRRRSPAAASCRPTSTAPGPTTGSATGWSRAMVRLSLPSRVRFAPVRRSVSDPDGCRFYIASRLRSVCRAHHRARPDGDDRVRPRRAAAIRHDGRDARLGSDQCARHAQPARRTFRHMQGRSRQASFVWVRFLPARPPCARSSGSSPMRSNARRSSMRSTAVRRISRACRCTACRFRSRTRSTRWTCARRRPPTRATTSTSRRRDHTLVAQLRQKGAIIYAKAVNTEYNGIPASPGGRNDPKQIIVSDPGYQRSTLGRQPAQRV